MKYEGIQIVPKSPFYRRSENSPSDMRQKTHLLIIALPLFVGVSTMLKLVFNVGRG